MEFIDTVYLVEPRLILVSSLFFLAGVLASIPAKKADHRLLTAYPLWIWKKVRESIDPMDPWLYLFVFLFTFNSVSLFVNFISGFLVLLPYLMAFLLGMNLGVIAIDEAGVPGLILMIALNPVAWIELPAAFISLAIGMQLGLEVVNQGFNAGVSAFFVLLRVYLFVVLPLLFAAALLESSLIKVLSPSEHQWSESRDE